MNATAKPKALPVTLTSIPQQLRDLDQWVLWQYEQKDGRWTKVPYSPRGQRAKSNDPRSWSEFRTVESAYKKGGYDGIGIVLAEGDGLVGVDLDKCMIPTGLNDAASEIWEKFGATYAEKSPSGTGLRIFGYGTPQRCGKGGHGNWIEVYDHTSPRYLTVTGHNVGGSRIAPCQTALNWLHERYMLKPEPKPATPRTTQPVSLSDQQLLDLARSAKNGADFSRLYDRGDCSMYIKEDGSHDHSSGDQALCNLLAFWCQCDVSQMDRLFRASALMRNKWDEQRGQQTYGERTIHKAIRDCKEVYTTKSAPAPTFAQGDQVSRDSRDSRDFRVTFAQTEKPEVEQKQDDEPDFSNFRANRALFPWAGVEVDRVPILPERPIASKFPNTPYDQLFTAIQDRTQAPFVLCAQAALAAMTLAVQHLADIEMPGIGGQSARRPISNFFITVAKSGERKSSVDRIVLEGVELAQVALDRFYKDLLFNYKRKLWDYQAEEREARSKGKSYDDLGDPPTPPKEPHLIAKEPTADGIFHSLLVGQYSQGLYNDEAATFLGGFGMSKENRMRTAGTFNRLWDGTRLDKPRSKTHESVKDRRFSVHLMIQPKASQELTGDAMLTDIGFTARCLIAEPDSAIGQRPFRDPNPDSILICQEFSKLVKELLEYPVCPNETGDGLAPRLLPLNKEAKQLWVEFYNEIERDLPTRYATIQGFASKAPEHALRLAAVLHLFGPTHQPNQGPNSPCITGMGIKIGIELVRFYLHEHLRLSAGQISKQDEDAQSLVDWLNRKWEGEIISLADICRSGPPSIRAREAAHKAVEVAVQTGHLVMLPGTHEVKGVLRKQCFKILRERRESESERP